MTRIAIIQGHPDAGQPHLCHALADAYGRESLFGLVDGASDARRAQWLQKMESLGRRGG